MERALYAADTKLCLTLSADILPVQFPAEFSHSYTLHQDELQYRMHIVKLMYNGEKIKYKIKTDQISRLFYIHLSNSYIL